LNLHIIDFLPRFAQFSAPLNRDKPSGRNEKDYTHILKSPRVFLGVTCPWYASMTAKLLIGANVGCQLCLLAKICLLEMSIALIRQKFNVLQVRQRN